MTITISDQKRLADIRMNLEKHRAMGFDVSNWEAEFLLNLINKIRNDMPIAMSSRKRKP